MANLTGAETLLVLGRTPTSASAGPAELTTTGAIANIGIGSVLTGNETLQVLGQNHGGPAASTFTTTTGKIIALAIGGSTNLTGTETLQVTAPDARNFSASSTFQTTTAAIAALRGGSNFSVNANYVGLTFSPGVIPGTPGVNFFPPVQTDFPYLASKGIKNLRLSILWERAQPTLSGALDDTYMGYVDNAITYATGVGMTINIAVFDQCRYNGNVIGGGTVTQAQFADLWSRISLRYAGNAVVAAYDLMNEPQNMPVPGVTWPNAAQAAINAIRLNDTVTGIFVDGENFSNTYYWPTVNPNLHLLVDPQNKITFSGHCYFDSDDSGQHYDWATEVAAGSSVPVGPLTTSIGVTRLTPFVGWLQQYGFRGNIGEMGTGTQDNAIQWLQCLDIAMAYAQQNNISVTYFAGPRFDDSYPYYLGPSTTNRAIDRSQMAIITKYSGAAPNPSYLLSVPSYHSASGVASQAMSLQYRGILASSIVITPSDSGAGGTFTPSTITFTGGAYNPSATFTYTPPNSGVFNISFTNTGTLQNPATFQYTSLSAFANILEWFDAADLTTLTVAAGDNAVTQWNDKSGNGLNLTNTNFSSPADANKPTSGTRTVNGKNSVQFNGTTQFLVRAAGCYGLSNGDNTVIAVYEVDNTSDNVIISMIGGSTNELRTTDTNTSFTGYSGDTGTGSILGGLTSDTTQHVVVMQSSGTSANSITLWRAGVKAQTLGTATHFTATAARLGGSATTFPLSMTGAICEIMTFNTALTTTQIDAVVDNMLKTKWAVAWSDVFRAPHTIVSGELITDRNIIQLVVPAATTNLSSVKIWGAGAVGGTGSGTGGGGSGSGGESVTTNMTVTAGQVININIGAAGITANAAAGATTLGASMIANGGVGGNFAFGGAGGTASGGTTNTTGATGTNGNSIASGAGGSAPGGGAGGAGPSGAGVAPGGGGGGGGVDGPAGVGALGGVQITI